MPAACMISWLYSNLMPMPHAAGRPYGVLAVYHCHTVQCLPLVSFAGCTVILCQCHMPPATPMVCWLYITVIQSNACHLYHLLVVQSSYANATCRRPPLWCASCIILSYSPIPAVCMISWLHNHLIPMPHAAGRPYGVPAVYYCHTVQCLPLVSLLVE